MVSKSVVKVTVVESLSIKVTLEASKFNKGVVPETLKSSL